MKVFKTGTRVRFKSGGIEGYITCVCIRVGWITYGISYFNSGAYAETWHNDFEFEVISEKTKAGFNKETPEGDENNSITLLING